ncbi:MAG: glycosyltransferase family 2 protein [Armatimonadetes bacterium]|nr:glycosyltransferase family 2 protein [Armatimonadota bacterium]
MGQHRIALVIPTRNRAGELLRLLESLARQTAPPHQVIVVDGGEETVEGIAGEFPALHVTYRRVYPPSLARQRNVGLQAMEPSITIAGFLDDDMVVEPDAVRAMLAFWESAPPDIGGVAFNIANQPRPRAIWLKSLFFMESRRRGVILRSGYHTSIGCVAQTVVGVDWLPGGASVWRRRVIDEFQYDEWFAGTGWMEDIEYSHRVRGRYRLAVVADAPVQHLISPMPRDRNFLFGQWEAVNRMYLVRKFPELSVGLCYWAILGQVLTSLGNAVLNRDPGLFVRAAGNCVGLGTLVAGRLPRIGGTLK